MAKKGTRLLLWITVIGLFIMVAMVVGVVLLLDAEPPGLDGEPRWLHTKIKAGLDDAPGAEGMLVDPQDLPPLTTELTALIRDAANDESVGGLFLEIQPLDLGWAQLQELRGALGDFQASGKPCVAWADTLTNKEYYLATACKEIHIAPAGLTLVNGLAVTQTYYAGTFEKLGVAANFEHVGDFKSAVEPYERTGPSEPAQAAMNEMIDSLYEQMLEGIAEGRGVTVEQARAWIDDPPMSASEALDLGMVDQLSYRDEITEKRIEPDLLSLKKYLRDRRGDWRSGGKKIAVIHASGAIVSGESQQDFFGGSYIGDRTMVEQLEDVREDDNIVAVVLRVDSPGGSGSASDAIWRAVELTKEEKPVVVSMGDYAASGGYYISMGANRIFAEPGTITGSIGVFGGKLNIAGLYEKVGVSLYTTERGRYADLLSSVSSFDEAERQKFKSFLQNFYDIFIDKAASGRGMSREEIHEVAQGRVWTGEQALERKLVDELGGLHNAIDAARELANVEGEVAIVRYPERKGFIDQLLEELTDPGYESVKADGAALAELPVAGEVISDLLMLDRVLRGGAAALLPGRVEVR